MSKRKRTIREVFITVEPSSKVYTLLLFRVGNYFVLLSLLLLKKFLDVPVPESLVLLVGSAVVGVDLHQIALTLGKFLKVKGSPKHV